MKQFCVWVRSHQSSVFRIPAATSKRSELLEIFFVRMDAWVREWARVWTALWVAWWCVGEWLALWVSGPLGQWVRGLVLELERGVQLGAFPMVPIQEHLSVLLVAVPMLATLVP
jgi:hypothetical protein